MTTTVRNVLIVLLIATAVYALPGGGAAANTVANLFSVILFAGLAWFAARLYLEHRVTIMDLEDRVRATIYGALGVAILTVTATPRLWETPAGVLIWFVLVGGASYSVYYVYRATRQY